MTSMLDVGWKGAEEAVASLAPVVEKYRDAGEADRRLAPEIIDAMLDSGLLRAWLPSELGGLELDVKSVLRSVGALSRLDGSTGWVYANMVAGSTQVAFMEAEARREIVTDNRGLANAGSVASVGRAVPEAGGYRLSGQWRLASGCHHAKWLGAAALVFDGEAPRMGPDGNPDLKIMFFPSAESEILDTWYSMGLKGTGSTDFRLDNVFIPEHRQFSLFTAPPQIGGPLYQAGILVPFSLALASVAPGIARAAIDVFVEMARDKTPTMSQTALGARPTIHAEVARAVTLVESAQAYLGEVADELIESLQAGRGVTPEIETKRRLACVNAGMTAIEAVDKVFTLAGTTPIYSGHRLERCMRDVRTAAQHFLVSPAWLEKTGQSYFGQGLAMP